jgi:uncharacterized protein (DUF433 family)
MSCQPDRRWRRCREKRSRGAGCAVSVARAGPSGTVLKKEVQKLLTDLYPAGTNGIAVAHRYQLRCPAVADSASAGQTWTVTTEQMELISTDPRVTHGQAVLAGTRVPVSVILDCLAAGMTAAEIVAEYPVVTTAGVRAAAAYGAALAREELLPLPHAQ